MSEIRHNSVSLMACAAVLGSMVLIETTSSAPLDPNAFASLGTLSVSSGTLTINTDTLAISGAAAFTGIVHVQGSGLPEIAVFTFDEVAIQNGVLSLTGSRPIAILSKSNVMIDRIININGGIPNGSSGGAARLGGGAGGIGHDTTDPQNGSGPGGGGISMCCDPGGYGGGGGGFGGVGGAGGGPNPIYFAPGGMAYGDLGTALQGGSGGGGGVKLTQISSRGGGGGGSGGAIEIGALGTVYVALISTQGAPGASANSNSGGGGGGSGGAVLLHGQMVTVAGGILADGGDGGASFGGTQSSGGGGGGGGRVSVQADMLSLDSVPFTSVSGGQAGTNNSPVFPAISGESGIAVLEPFTTIIPTGHLVQVQADGVLPSGTAGASWILETDRLRFDAGSIGAALAPVASAHDIELNGGNVFAALGWIMTGPAQISGFGQMSGAVSGGETNYILASGGALTLGDANNMAGFSFAGTVDIDAGSTLNLLDSNMAELGEVTTLASGGRLNSLNGIHLGAGETLTANSGADIGGEFANQGIVNGPTAAGEFLTFTDDVYGAGNYTGNVRFSDGFAPGNSVAAVSLENVTFDSSASILMELGGREPGMNYDQLIIIGDSTINGTTLDVKLIDNFTPSLGDQFQIFSLASPVSGTGFSGFDLSTLGAGLEWKTDTLLTTGILSVVAVSLPGDFDFDGDVDGRDFLMWQRNPSVGNLADWQANYGVPLTPAVNAVPEPSSIIMASLAAIATQGQQRRFRKPFKSIWMRQHGSTTSEE